MPAMFVSTTVPIYSVGRNISHGLMLCELFRNSQLEIFAHACSVTLYTNFFRFLFVSICVTKPINSLSYFMISIWEKYIDLQFSNWYSIQNPRVLQCTIYKDVQFTSQNFVQDKYCPKTYSVDAALKKWRAQLSQSRTFYIQHSSSLWESFYACFRTRKHKLAHAIQTNNLL